MPSNIKESNIVTKKSLNIKNLFLDPNNYRFADEADYKRIDEKNLLADRVQKCTRAFIEGSKRTNIRDLIDSFKANGFLKVDVIQLCNLGDNNYLVIEGNRRVAALKCLQDDYESGKDIGKLDPSIFKSVPAEIIPRQDNSKEQLVIMGLKHISGNKKWAAINQAQLIFDYLKDSWDDKEKYAIMEDELCRSLGITKQRLRSTQRTIHLINLYKKSDYGDQFKTDMYSIFEEIIKKNQIKEWLEWDEATYTPANKFKMDRLFSWISIDDKIDEETDEPIEREPIINKASEIRALADFITNKDALDVMEKTESVTTAHEKSGANERTNIEKSIDIIQKNVIILKRYSDVLDDEDIKNINVIEKDISFISPRKNAINLLGKNISYYNNDNNFAQFSSIYVHSYNKLNGFSLSGLNRINIFAGKNNSGKTTLLEAIYYLCNQNDLGGFFDVSKIRRKNNEIYGEYLYDTMKDLIKIEAVYGNSTVKVEYSKFNDLQVDKSDVYISSFRALGEIDGAKNSMVIHAFEKGDNKVEYRHIQHLCRSYFSSPYYSDTSSLMDLYNIVVETKSDGVNAMTLILDFLKQIDPSISNIELKIKNGVPVFLVDSERFPDNMVELNSYGDGLVRIFEMALCLVFCRNGVLLIDELETAIHFSMLVKYTEFIQKMAEKFNVQVFLTTHSKECIDAFIENGYNNNQISAYSVKDLNGKTEVKYLSGEKLEQLIDLISFDLRGGN